MEGAGLTVGDYWVASGLSVMFRDTLVFEMSGAVLRNKILSKSSFL